MNFRYLSSLFWLSACLLFAGSINAIAATKAKVSKKELATLDDPEGDYYRAMNNFAKGSWGVAITGFELVEQKYPVHTLAKMAAIMQAFSHYLNKEYEKSIDVIENINSLAPNGPYANYLAFLKAMCYYRRITGLTKSYEMLLYAKMEFDGVYNKDLLSPYGAEAKRKSLYLSSVIAYDEILVGEEYQRQGNYFAAIRRYNSIVRLDIKDLLPIAYFRLWECYRDLGLREEENFYLSEFNEIMEKHEGSIGFKIGYKIRYVPVVNTESMRRQLESTLKQNKNYSDWLNSSIENTLYQETQNLDKSVSSPHKTSLISPNTTLQDPQGHY